MFDRLESLLSGVRSIEWPLYDRERWRTVVDLSARGGMYRVGRQWMEVSMSEAIELRLVIDGAVLKGVRRWAQLENFTGGWPADYEPTTEELTTAAREMLAECAGRLGCEVCGAPGPGDHPRAGLSGNPFGMSEDRDSYFALELDCDDGNLGGYLGAWAKDEAGWSCVASTIVDYCPNCGRRLNHA